MVSVYTECLAPLEMARSRACGREAGIDPTLVTGRHSMMLSDRQPAHKLQTCTRALTRNGLLLLLLLLLLQAAKSQTDAKNIYCLIVGKILALH